MTSSVERDSFGDSQCFNQNLADEIEWVQQRIKLEKFDLNLWKEEHTSTVSDFLSNSSIKSLFATVDWDSNHLLVCNNSPPSPTYGRKEVAFFVRGEGEKITISNIDDVLNFGTFAMDQNAASVLNIMMNIFCPVIFEAKWNKPSKIELLGLYHRFMASLTESSNEDTGKTTLYLPFQNHDEPNIKEASYDRDFFQQLESVAIHWSRQIRAVLNNHIHLVSDSTEPIEEITFWRSRAVDLSSISTQLKSAKVKSIVEILQASSSKYVQSIEILLHDLTQKCEEAENNVKFLQILEEPCKRLEEMNPKEILLLLPDLMNSARVIYSLSLNYNSYSHISGLLRRISIQIIRRCSEQVICKKKMDCNIGPALTILDQCVKCCTEWKNLYNRTAKTVNDIDARKRKSESLATWKYDDSSIFAEMNAFIQRCGDLIEIYHCRIQFSLTSSNLQFTGVNGQEVEKVLSSISASFNTQIERLNKIHYDIFDVKLSLWHHDFNTFKSAVKVRSLIS